MSALFAAGVGIPVNAGEMRECAHEWADISDHEVGVAFDTGSEDPVFVYAQSWEDLRDDLLATVRRVERLSGLDPVDHNMQVWESHPGWRVNVKAPVVMNVFNSGPHPTYEEARDAGRKYLDERIGR